MKELLKMNLQMFAEQDEESTETGAVEEESSEQTDEQQEEMIPKSQMEKIIKDRVAREKKAADAKIAEAEKLAKMNESEAKQYEFEKLQNELAELKRKDVYHGLSKEASKMLAEQSIQVDDDLLAFVVKDTAEDTQTAVNSFVSLINTKVEEGVKKALSGKAPAFNNGTNNAMTKKDILQIKDSSERIKAIQNNPQLFK